MKPAPPAPSGGARRPRGKVPGSSKFTRLAALQCVAIGTQDLGDVDLTPPVTVAMAAIGAGILVAVVGLALMTWRFASSWTARPRH